MFKLRTISYIVSKIIRLIALLFPVPAKMAYYSNDNSAFEDRIRELELTDKNDLIGIIRQNLAKQDFQTLLEEQKKLIKLLNHEN